MLASYISIYDDYVPYERECNYDPICNEVYDLQDFTDIPEGILTEEYVELPDGSMVNDYYIRDLDIHVRNGIPDLEYAS